MPNTNPITPEMREADAQWCDDSCSGKHVVHAVGGSRVVHNAGTPCSICRRLTRLAALSRGVGELERALTAHDKAFPSTELPYYREWASLIAAARKLVGGGA